MKGKEHDDIWRTVEPENMRFFLGLTLTRYDKDDQSDDGSPVFDLVGVYVA